MANDLTFYERKKYVVQYMAGRSRARNKISRARRCSAGASLREARNAGRAQSAPHAADAGLEHMRGLRGALVEEGRAVLGRDVLVVLGVVVEHVDGEAAHAAAKEASDAA